MARKAITRTEARRRARARAAEVLEREDKMVSLVADWEQATDTLNLTYAAMYKLGFSRSVIADRLGVTVARVPRLEELDEPRSEDDDAGADEEGSGGSDSDSEVLEEDQTRP